jgi:hypothetical protein
MSGPFSRLQSLEDLYLRNVLGELKVSFSNLHSEPNLSQRRQKMMVSDYDAIYMMDRSGPADVGKAGSLESAWPLGEKARTLMIHGTSYVQELAQRRKVDEAVTSIFIEDPYVRVSRNCGSDRCRRLNFHFLFCNQHISMHLHHDLYSCRCIRLSSFPWLYSESLIRSSHLLHEMIRIAVQKGRRAHIMHSTF